MTHPNEDSEKAQAANERPLFPHPPWTVGIVLIIAVLAILAGISDPLWLLLGAPCILVLLLFLYVRVVSHFRSGPRSGGRHDDGA